MAVPREPLPNEECTDDDTSSSTYQVFSDKEGGPSGNADAPSLDLPDNQNLVPSTMNFLNFLQSLPNIPLSVVQSVSQNLLSLIEEISDFAVESIATFCHVSDIDPNSPAAHSLMESIFDIPQAFQVLSTDYKRIKYLKDTGCYVEPKEVVLGTRTEQLFDHKLGFMKTRIVEDSFQYVSLDTLLEKILSASVIADLFTQRKHHERKMRHWGLSQILMIPEHSGNTHSSKKFLILCRFMYSLMPLRQQINLAVIQEYINKVST